MTLTRTHHTHTRTRAHQVHFGRDFETQLNFYVECRQTFANVDAVMEALVVATCTVIMETLRIVGGTHSRKTKDFVRACVAYCYITIPSIESITTRLSLYLSAGQVALANSCIPQVRCLFFGGGVAFGC